MDGRPVWHKVGVLARQVQLADLPCRYIKNSRLPMTRTGRPMKGLTWPDSGSIMPRALY